MNKLHYTTQSTDWLEGLPIGNGRLAAMVWGDTNADVLTLNHEWLWRGTNRARKPAESAQHLEYVRSLLKERDFFKAIVAANLYFAGDGGISPKKGRVDAYQVAGTLEFTPPELQSAPAPITHSLFELFKRKSTKYCKKHLTNHYIWCILYT